jgi:hypothetical protein
VVQQFQELLTILPKVFNCKFNLIMVTNNSKDF